MVSAPSDPHPCRGARRAGYRMGSSGVVITKKLWSFMPSLAGEVASNPGEPYSTALSTSELAPSFNAIPDSNDP
ncbi:hypothetical protein AL55_02639 [Mycobacterium tuberculosis TKK_03_0100]|nr:hypothetical protein AL55_02639 [Mycobacterium tuberculosis TKK_03_0100]KCL71189.1 hypothetical protein W084_03142 [Mycobacterium tuberculosis TB_RSA174]COW45293.1 Uncharacterised protein [Mycobacterium tuberculosis]